MSTPENRLLQSIPGKDRRALLSGAETVQLNSTEVLGRSGIASRYVYFPVDCFVSLLASIEGQPVIEMGMVGREGLIGAHVALGVYTQPLDALVQGPGRAWRITASVFRRALEQSPSLRRLVEQYLYVQMTQQVTSAACAHLHQIDTRLGRWLLMMQDRAHANTFNVTHELLAYMLGVRRVSVTIAAVALQRKGIIKYSRGHITVLDRQGLEAAACRCYMHENRVYARVIG